MNTGYSFSTRRTGSLAALMPRPSLEVSRIYQIRHNGVPVPDIDGHPVECSSIWSACDRIDQLSAEYCSSVACFRADPVNL